MRCGVVMVHLVLSLARGVDISLQPLPWTHVARYRRLDRIQLQVMDRLGDSFQVCILSAVQRYASILVYRHSF
jgi:hypothetical protein